VSPPRPPRRTLEPLETDDVRAVSVGTAAWLVAFLALLPFAGRLAETGHIRWLWTCLAGFGLGVLGVEYCRRRRAALRRDGARRAAESAASLREPLT
jgi:hypothetical protein